MNNEELTAFWKKGARLDKKTSDDLFKAKNYVACLFFTHLYLEKTLKGIVQKISNKTPPFTHDLLVLSKIANLTLDKKQEEYLAVINTFNIRARYSDYKFSFYKKATKGFALKYRKIAEEIYLWFLKQY